MIDQSWLNKRNEIVKRDNYQCQRCGRSFLTPENLLNPSSAPYDISDECYLIVHHTYYINKRRKSYYPDASLISLCMDCHHKIHESQEIPKYPKYSYLPKFEKPLPLKALLEEIKGQNRCFLFREEWHHELVRIILTIGWKSFAIHLIPSNAISVVEYHSIPYQRESGRAPKVIRKYSARYSSNNNVFVMDGNDFTPKNFLAIWINKLTESTFNPK